MFIPELGETFRAAPGFRLFGAQNPVSEGGGRRGLPRSFLNRFTRVAIELLREEDLLFISGESTAATVILTRAPSTAVWVSRSGGSTPLLLSVCLRANALVYALKN